MSLAQIVSLVVALAVGLVWLILWVRRGLAQGRAAASEAADRAGFLYQVRCEKCGNEREATYAEVMATAMSKSKGVTAEAQAGPIGAGATHYTYFAKKLTCPRCGRKTWHQILNYNGHDAQAVRNTASATVPLLINGAIGLAGLTAIVMAVFTTVM